MTKDTRIESNGHAGSNSVEEKTRVEVEERYRQERENQLKRRHKIPYIDLATSGEFESFVRDPWLKSDDCSIINSEILSQGSPSVLIMGAGYGGLLFAVRLIQSGAYTANDIVLMDTAGGFGGTWYWNRYPGLMCDVESYMYMPLLEETGYMPKMKYASGAELRVYAELIAEKWGLQRRALFRTTLQSLQWNDEKNNWTAHAHRYDISDQPVPITINADIVIMASGPFSGPQAPGFPGIHQYKGDMFHTSRWNYEVTGGTPENQEMSKLKDKRVGIIGTGATAIQVVPELSNWAKELTVFQRTPSSVDWRNNYPTPVDWWKKEIANASPGWQRRRIENFNAFTSNVHPRPSENVVGDAWTTMFSFSALSGGPQSLDQGYPEEISALDYDRQERIRARVSDIVSNKEVADKLKPWYQGWCKRPCFHDDYLNTFNKPNVKLVDMRDTSIDRFTEKGIVVGGAEHELDTIVLSTGFTISRMSPAAKAEITVTGRNGKSMHEKWIKKLATHHGVISKDFPNLFYPGPFQTAACANQMYVLDQISIHVAYMVSTALQRTPEGKKPIIESSIEAEERWAGAIMGRARALGLTVNCTPGYYNGDGAVLRAKSVEQQMSSARMAIWGEGVASYVNVIEQWRARGDLDGLEIEFVKSTDAARHRPLNGRL